jgi:hypothetical protein
MFTVHWRSLSKDEIFHGQEPSYLADWAEIRTPKQVMTPLET